MLAVDAANLSEPWGGTNKFDRTGILAIENMQENGDKTCFRDPPLIRIPISDECESRKWEW